jgi:hypothetical protein
MSSFKFIIIVIVTTRAITLLLLLAHQRASNNENYYLLRVIRIFIFILSLLNYITDSLVVNKKNRKVLRTLK